MAMLGRTSDEEKAAKAARKAQDRDSKAPSLTVIADQDGNKGIVCVDVSAAKQN